MRPSTRSPPLRHCLIATNLSATTHSTSALDATALVTVDHLCHRPPHYTRSLKPEQRAILEATFDLKTTPDSFLTRRLAEECNLNPRQVQARAASGPPAPRSV